MLCLLKIPFHSMAGNSCVITVMLSFENHLLSIEKKFHNKCRKVLGKSPRVSSHSILSTTSYPLVVVGKTPRTTPFPALWASLWNTYSTYLPQCQCKPLADRSLSSSCVRCLVGDFSVRNSWSSRLATTYLLALHLAQQFSILSSRNLANKLQ